MSTPYHNKALPEGTILREWRLEHILGAGGFGIVYRARGVYFDELVAIKEYFPSAISDRRGDSTVAPNDTASEEVYALGLQKFVEEAKVLWNLSKPERHPNIVSVRSLFEIHGTAYMVMDFESGVSLSQMLKDGRKFTEDELMGLIRPIAQGLDRAHRAGVLHRDIKPANILVDDTGRPVLIDFGSARFDSGQATSTKVTFYTPPYAAIEQYVRTYPQGPWTDIYALGVALYQCVTGEKPPEVLERLHGGEGEALSSKERPGFSRAFTRAVDAAMAIRPGDRPQSIGKWLDLFDDPEPEEDDPALEATSIAASAIDPPTMVRPVMETVPAEPPKPPPAAPVAAAAPTPAPVAAKPPPIPVRQRPTQTPVDETAPPRRPAPWRWAAIAGVVAIGGGGAAWLLRPAPATGPAPGAPPAATAGPASGPAATAEPPGAPAAAGAAAPTPSGAASPLLAQLDGFIAEAKRLNRPSADIAAATAARAKLGDLDGQVRALGSNPAKAAPLTAEMNRLGLDLARSQGAALKRALAKRAGTTDADLASLAAQRASGAISLASADEAGVVATLKRLKGDFDAAVSQTAKASDAGAALTAAQAAQAAFGQVADAYGAASQFYLPAMKQGFAAKAVTVRQIAAQVAATLASARRPNFLSSKASKDAYKLLQDNATRAKTVSGDIDQAASSAASATERGQLNAADAKLAEIKAELTRLNTASREAAGAPAGQ